MSRRRPRRSTARMIAWYLTACAAIGAVALADELLRHGLLAVLALAGPVAGYAAGRVHANRRAGRRRSARDAGAAEVIRLQSELEALRIDRDRAAAALDAAGQRCISTYAGCRTILRDQILADPRSGARPLGSDR